MEATKPELDTHAGKSIQVACQMFGASLSHLADHLEVSRQHVHSMQKTKRINKDRVAKISEFFGMEPAEFLMLSSKPIGVYYRQVKSQIIDALDDEHKNQPEWIEAKAHMELVNQLLTDIGE